MMRAWLAILVGAGILFGSVNTARAKPQDPSPCTYELGFAAIHEMLGEEIVGECVSNQTFDRFGNASQETTEGVLFWLAHRNEVSFHNGNQLWTNGPRGEGIGSRITIGGLGDRESRNDPVTVPAIAAFELAALSPEAVGGDWWYGTVPKVAPVRLEVGCAPDRVDPTFGSTYVWFLNEEDGSSFVQILYGMADDDVASARQQMEAEAAACDGWTEKSRFGTARLHYRIEPFANLGDDSALIEYAIENVETGERRASRSAYVRYGGLVSMLTLLAPMDLPREAADAELGRLARLADESVRTAAWYLRD